MSEVTTETNAPVEQLSLNDLQYLVQIVDLASTRGAFRGNELSQVGRVFDKVTRFLEATAQASVQEEGDVA